MFKINYHYLFFFTTLFVNNPNALFGFDMTNSLGPHFVPNRTRTYSAHNYEVQEEQSASLPTYQHPERAVSAYPLFPMERSITPQPYIPYFNSSTNTFIQPSMLPSWDFTDNNFSLPITYDNESLNVFPHTNSHTIPYCVPQLSHENQDENHILPENNKTKKVQNKKKKSTKTYTCPTCQKNLANPSSFSYHIKTHDPNRPRPYKCHLCPKSFIKKCTLRDHIRTHTGEKPFKCDICGKGLSSKHALDRHLNKHENKKPYSCKECKKSFRRRNRLNEHRKLHKDKKPYKCSLCPNAYTTKCGLNYHVKVHSRPKAYTCHYCGAAFVYKKEYENHIRYEEEKDEDRKCHICKKIYADKYCLAKHNKRAHP